MKKREFLTEEEAKLIVAKEHGFNSYKDFYWLTYSYRTRQDADARVRMLCGK